MSGHTRETPAAVLAGLLLLFAGLVGATAASAAAAPSLLAQGSDAARAWALRFGVFRTAEDAEDLASVLRSLGQQSRLLLTRCGTDRPLYHVLVGRYRSPRAADAAPVWRELAGFRMEVVETAARDPVDVVDLAPADCPYLPQPPRNPDDEPADDRLTLELSGRPLILGGDYTLTSSYRKDFRLDRDREDDLWRLDQELQGNLTYKIDADLTLFLEAKLESSNDVYAEDDDTESETAFSRGETWLYWNHVGGSEFAVQAGRINIQENREWWWDQDLDGLRVHHLDGNTELDLVLAQELAAESSADDGIDPADEDVLRLFVEWQWEYANHHRWHLFALGQADSSRTHARNDLVEEIDEDEVDTDAWWLGTRLAGRWRSGDWGRLYYWGDLGLVYGRETELDFDDAPANDGTRIVASRVTRDLRGWGLDLGTIWQLPGSRSWGLDRAWIALGYARGSGDEDPDDATDHSFHQTGVNDNSQRLRGISRFYYYGEMLRPELSNLEIVTAAIGFKPDPGSSFDLVYHAYQQVDARDELRASRLRADPDGVSTDIGSEIDLIYGIEWGELSLDAALGRFAAGRAFSDRRPDSAWIFNLELEYRF